MTSSALTGNTSGLASATSPGLVGISTQTFAGKKTLDGGALIKGDTSGVAIAASYVGEFTFGSQSTGTGGSTYYVETTTAIVAAGVTLVSLTLNKGNYFLSFYHQWQSPDATTRTSTYLVRIGGTNVTTAFLQDKTQALMFGCFSFSIPIIITTDSTAVSLFGSCTALSGAALNNKAVISGFRFA